MNTALMFDTRSRECGWSPFLDWMRRENLEPDRTRSITIDPDTVTSAGYIAVVTAILLDEDGSPCVDGDEIATEQIRLPVSTLPPRLPAYGHVAATAIPTDQ